MKLVQPPLLPLWDAPLSEPSETVVNGGFSCRHIPVALGKAGEN